MTRFIDSMLHAAAILVVTFAVCAAIDTGLPAPRHHPEPWAMRFTRDQTEQILARAFELSTRIQAPGADAWAETPAGPEEQQRRAELYAGWRAANGFTVEAVLQAVEEIVPAGVPR